MNEIIATLYYCFYNDENRFFKRNCECDVYFVFEKVMAQIKQNFLVGNDRKLVEIEQKTKQFNELFKKFDIKLWEHLKKTNITPEFYFNKWLILLLTQEFEIKHVLCLWDGLIASGKMLEYIIYLCLGVLFSMREALLAGDFSEIMELLQSTSKLDVKVILNLANNIFNENI